MEILATHCIFPVTDLERTAAYYESALGFRPVEYPDAARPCISLHRDVAEIVLLQSAGPVRPNRSLCGYGYDAYIITGGGVGLQEELRGKGAKIVRSLEETGYRTREFVVEDPDGRWLGFACREE